MRYTRTLAATIFVGLLAACSSPEERAADAQRRSYEAQEKVAKKRLELVDKYQECVKAAAGDNLKSESCNSYLRAAEALK